MQKKPTKIHILSSYNYGVGKNPIIGKVYNEVLSAGMTYTEIQRNGGPNSGTLRNWFHKKTLSPQDKTIEAALRAMGKHRVIVDLRNPNDAFKKLKPFKAVKLIPAKAKALIGKAAQS